jgi:hypothetical protein
MSNEERNRLTVGSEGQTSPKPTSSPGLSKFVRWATGVVLSSLLVGIVFNTWTPDRLWHRGTWALAHHSLSAVPSDCGSTAWLKPVQPIEAEAYNELAPEGDATYYASNARDNNPVTAWAQPFPDRNGKSWITWDLGAVYHVRLACIQSGYAKNYTAYATNERVRAAAISFPGTRCATVHVVLPDLLRSATEPNSTGDYASPNPLVLDCRTSKVTLQVNSVYPATDHSHDVAISDAMFFSS